MIDLVEHNPMLKRPLLTVLHLCADERTSDRASLEAAALEAWDDDAFQSPSTCIDILLRNGALEERVLVDGEPYEGSFEDIQLDERVPDDAEVEARLSVTDVGRELAEHYAPEATLAALFAERPRYHDYYVAVLQASAAPDGGSRSDLEAAVDALPQPYADPETRRRKVYPQYFIDALETAGGIEWNGAWHTTEAGREFLAGN